MSFLRQFPRSFSAAAAAFFTSLDLKRNLLYVGTGNDYSPPSTSTSDSIIAFDMDTGAIQWVRQIVENDIWSSGCRQPDPDPAVCPDVDAPDFDFPASPILRELQDGREILIATQKSGLIYALDPDQEGKTIWELRVAKGGTQGGILFGSATDGENVYAAISDFARLTGRVPNPDVGGGIVAVSLGSGQKIWHAPPPGCGDRRPCSPAQAARQSPSRLNSNNG